MTLTGDFFFLNRTHCQEMTFFKPRHQHHVLLRYREPGVRLTASNHFNLRWWVSLTSLAPVFPVTMTYLDVFCSVRETETETERQRQRDRERGRESSFVVLNVASG